MASRAHSKSIDIDANLLMYLMLVVAFVGVMLFSAMDLSAGTIYFTMFVGFFGLISIIFIVFAKNDETIRGLTQYIRNPFTTNLGLACLFYMTGRLTPYLIQLILYLFKKSGLIGQNFNVSSFSIPFSSSAINQAYTSLSTAEIGSSQATRNFLIEFVAGSLETFIFNFFLVIIGGMVGLVLFKLLSSDGLTALKLKKKVFVIIVAFTISIIGFVYAHTFNGSYEGYMFVVAGIFLLVSNASIYLWSVFLSFWAGYHPSNNQVWLILEDGFRTVLSGYLSVYGVIYVLFHILVVYYIIRNWGSIMKNLRRWLTIR